MKLLCNKRCIIGEGPIWNEKENLLYFINGLGKEICMCDIYTGEFKTRPLDIDVAAIAFDHNNRMIVSRKDGVFYLNDDDTLEEIYDTSKYQIQYANDMKVGPDGRIYVGTQSRSRLGISDKTDGKLYCIDKSGNVTVLLDGLILSNGMDWSMDETLFFHTDSESKIIKEYAFDQSSGTISFTGKMVDVPGVDGFTIDQNDCIWATGWGYGCVYRIDTKRMKIIDSIKTLTNAPASCGFAGNNMDLLIIVTSSFLTDITTDINAGFAYIHHSATKGRKPYLF